MLSRFDKQVLKLIYTELDGRTLVLWPTAPARSFWNEVSDSYQDLEPGETPEVDAKDALEYMMAKLGEDGQ